MSKRERKMLLALGLLVIVMVIAIGVTFYATRILPLDNIARTQVYYDATERARD